jgi:2,3-bisphosphoglycerate-independent phosphoglycerate mutase
VPSAGDAATYIRQRYDAGINDEFLEPVAIVPPGTHRVRLEDRDVAVFFNFRPDRARELSHALIDATCDGFPRTRVVSDLRLVTFSEYDRLLGAPVAFPKPDVRNTLAEVVSAAGLRQYHVAETEKYAHVTYFINGGREAPFEGEDRELIPSQRVATYEETPAMSAEPVTDAVIARIAAGVHALIVVNFANPDMVGHTGDFNATVAAVEVVDACLGRIAAAAQEAGGAVLITADHGNAELMIDLRDNSVLTAQAAAAFAPAAGLPMWHRRCSKRWASPCRPR